MKNAKIGYFSHQKSGCQWYRVKRPMDLLQANGVDTHIVSLNEDIDDDIQAFQLYGAYPFSFEKPLRWMKENGKKIVYDVDDALSLVDLSNPFYYSVKKNLFSVREILSYADEVTVSTPFMADFIRPQTKAKVTVLPNCYTPSEWNFPRPQREGIRVGFIGSATHVPDLIQVLPAIKKMQDKYDIKFLLMGFDKFDYDTWFKHYTYVATPEALDDLLEFDRLIKDIKFEFVPFVDFELFPQVLTNMALDIGLCPLKETPFNNARSASKAMEYNLSGALALASDVIPYRQDPTSVLVKNWETDLEYWILHNKERVEKHREHLDWIKKNRPMETQLDLLKSIYVV